MEALSLVELIESGREDWHTFALCSNVDPETFFPEKGGSTKEAKRICNECDVLDQCRDFALAHDKRYGIWGGLSEAERSEIKKTRRLSV